MADWQTALLSMSLGVLLAWVLSMVRIPKIPQSKPLVRMKNLRDEIPPRVFGLRSVEVFGDLGWVRRAFVTWSGVRRWADTGEALDVDELIALEKLEVVEACEKARLDWIALQNEMGKND